MRLLGDKGGVAELSRKNYDEMLEAKARDEAEVEKLTAIENEYLAANEDVFKDEKSFNNALNELQRSGKVPSAIANDPTRLQEFYNAFGVRVLMDLYKQNLRSYEEKEEDFYKNSEKYALGEKTFSFSDKSPAEVFALAEKLIEQTLTKAYKQGKGIKWNPRSQQDAWFNGPQIREAEKKNKKEQEEYEKKRDKIVEQQAEEALFEEETADLPHKSDAQKRRIFALRRGFDFNGRIYRRKEKLVAELTEKYDAEHANSITPETYDAKAVPMVPVTSGTGFTWEDADALKKAIATTNNMLAGNMIIQTLKAADKIEKGTESVEIVKLEDSNLYVHFLNEKKEKIGGTTFSGNEKHGITENITLYLAE